MKIFEFPIRLSIVMVALTYCDHHIRAQNFGGEYITEWQTDFSGSYNWANLLRLSADIHLSRSLAFEAATLSISQTDQNPIIADLQGFSNIAEDNCALTLAMLGVGWRSDRTQLFVGIRNVNEDYFTTPFTSLFTNSSCGIYPTLSHNYEIANYPLSSWSIHFAQAWDILTLNLSVYNGRAYQRFSGRDNMFRLSPKDDGVFSIISLNHQKNDCNYTFGLAAFHGVHTPEMGGDTVLQTQVPAPKKTSFAPWINVEQTIAQSWQLMLQASMSTYSHGCRYFAGAGLKYSIDDIDIALYTDYARYSDDDEVASELTCRIPLSAKSYLQPAIHLISTNSRTRCVGLLRFGLEF